MTASDRQMRFDGASTHTAFTRTALARAHATALASCLLPPDVPRTSQNSVQILFRPDTQKSLPRGNSYSSLRNTFLCELQICKPWRLIT
jgi:hypothetical protein